MFVCCFARFSIGYQAIKQCVRMWDLDTSY